MKQLMFKAFSLTQRAMLYINPAREGDAYQRLTLKKGISISLPLRIRKIYA